MIRRAGSLAEGRIAGDWPARAAHH